MDDKRGNNNGLRLLHLYTLTTPLNRQKSINEPDNLRLG